VGGGGTIAPFAPPMDTPLVVSSQLRHISTSGKNLLNSNISSKRPHNVVNFGPLTAEICWRVWGTPANFNGFRVLASLLQRRRSPEANQTLHDVWPSLGLVRYIYTFGDCCSLTEFCPVQNSLYVQVLRSLLLTALLHGTPAAGVSQTLRRGTRNGTTELSQRRHLYSAGRPLRWASAHISSLFLTFMLVALILATCTEYNCNIWLLINATNK